MRIDSKKFLSINKGFFILLVGLIVNQQLVVGVLAAEIQPVPGDQQPVAVATSDDSQKLAENVQEKEESIDEFTQSEAHMQLSQVKANMENFPLEPAGVQQETQKIPNELVTPYLNIVAAVLDKEEEFKGTHAAFYHATKQEWRVAQDLYKQLYAYRRPLQPVKDFIFLRFTDLPSLNAQQYLKEHIGQYAGVNDNAKTERDRMIAVNFALFGNVGFPGECTWNYFLRAKSHRIPLATHYHEILKAFHFTYDIETLTKEANALLENLLKTEEQVLLQIFVPYEKVDDIAWLSTILGFPAHKKSLAIIEQQIEAAVLGGAIRAGSLTGPVVKKLMKKYQKEGPDSPQYKDLIEAVNNGDFGVIPYLKSLCTDPLSLKDPDPNQLQARLLVEKDVLLNPKSGVKFFQYVTTPRKVQEEYVKQLNLLVQKIIKEEKNKSDKQKASDKAKNIKTAAKIEEEQLKILEKEKKKKMKELTQQEADELNQEREKKVKDFETERQALKKRFDELQPKKN